MALQARDDRLHQHDADGRGAGLRYRLPWKASRKKKVREVLKLPLSYTVVGLLAIGHLRGDDKFYGGRSAWPAPSSTASTASPSSCDRTRVSGAPHCWSRRNHLSGRAGATGAARARSPQGRVVAARRRAGNRRDARRGRKARSPGETGLIIEPITKVEVFNRIARDDEGRVQFHYVLVDYLCRITGGSAACAR